MDKPKHKMTKNTNKDNRIAIINPEKCKPKCNLEMQLAP
jgi:hypothetical protein